MKKFRANRGIIGYYGWDCVKITKWNKKKRRDIFVGWEYCLIINLAKEDIDTFISKNSLSFQEKTELIKKILISLEFIHEDNIIHKDIKPSNILIDVSDNIKFCDFGLGKFPKSKNLTFSDERQGSRYYAAPELHKPNPHISQKCDIYSIGKVIYFILSNGNIFEGEGFNSKITDLQRRLNDIRYNDFNHLIFPNTINAQIDVKENENKNEYWKQSRYIFRGQTESTWDLQPSLERLLNLVNPPSWAEEVRKSNNFEQTMWSVYKSRSKLWNENQEESLWEWITRCQHSGGTTRLLDFTTSFDNATFFALYGVILKNSEDLRNILRDPII